MNRLNNISEDINNKYGFNTKLEGKTLPYNAEYTGKYVFTINGIPCTSYVTKNTQITNEFDNINFTTEECNSKKGSITSATLTEIWHNGDDTSE